MSAPKQIDPKHRAKQRADRRAAEERRHAELIRELRTIALVEIGPRDLALPPPADVAAEVTVLEAVLCGRRRPSQLACRAADFWHPLHAGAFAVCESLEELDLFDGSPSIERIAAVLARQGANETRALQGLREIVEDAPVCLLVDELAERVREFAEQRRTIRAMQEYDAALRAGLPADAQLAALRAQLERMPKPRGDHHAGSGVTPHLAEAAAEADASAHHTTAGSHNVSPRAACDRSASAAQASHAPTQGNMTLDPEAPEDVAPRADGPAPSIEAP